MLSRDSVCRILARQSHRSKLAGCGALDRPSLDRPPLVPTPLVLQLLKIIPLNRPLLDRPLLNKPPRVRHPRVSTRRSIVRRSIIRRPAQSSAARSTAHSRTTTLLWTDRRSTGCRPLNRCSTFHCSTARRLTAPCSTNRRSAALYLFPPAARSSTARSSAAQSSTTRPTAYRRSIICLLSLPARNRPPPDRSPFNCCSTNRRSSGACTHNVGRRKRRWRCSRTVRCYRTSHDGCAGVGGRRAEVATIYSIFLCVCVSPPPSHFLSPFISLFYVCIIVFNGSPFKANTSVPFVPSYTLRRIWI